jgi:hypothetical protein
MSGGLGASTLSWEVEGRPFDNTRRQAYDFKALVRRSIKRLEVSGNDHGSPTIKSLQYPALPH